MRLRFWELWTLGRAQSPKSILRRVTPLRFRPAVECLEGRLVLSAAAVHSPHFAAGLVAPGSHGSHQAAPVQFMALNISGIVVQGGQLVATGSLAGTTFQLPLTLSASPNAANPSCPILNVQISQGIHLTPVPGLKIDTSAISLGISSPTTPTTTLGSQVCDLATALSSGGVGLSAFLGGLTTDQLNGLLSGLTGVVNSVLSNLTTINLAGSPGATVSVTGAKHNTLELTLPATTNLTISGLSVSLNNGQGGPVTVDITATHSGATRHLANHLRNLFHLLHSHANSIALGHAMNRVANDLAALI